MNTSEIPGDTGVAIEYRVNGRAFRIDFMLSGKNFAGKESLVIIELKQWTDIQFLRRKKDLQCDLQVFFLLFDDYVVTG